MNVSQAGLCVVAIREAAALAQKGALARRQLFRAPNRPAEVSLPGNQAVSDGAARSSPRQNGGGIARRRALRPEPLLFSYKPQQAPLEFGPAFRESIRATSFDEPSAQTACRFVSASGRTPANETRGGAFCFVGLMLFYPFACRATACVPLKPDRSI
jgi:hypothetical protein